MSRCLWLICVLLWHGGAAAVALPVFSDSGPDAAAYSAAQNYPIARPSNNHAQATMVGTFSHYDQALKSGRLSKPAVVSPLRRASEELKLAYAYAGADYSLADYLNRNPATGLLIAHDDEIVFEHYQYARTDRDRLVSQSISLADIAQSITTRGMLRQTTTLDCVERVGSDPHIRGCR